ncbi:MAG: methyltransferase domain-containing protein [Kofleriaceae bacterium]|nr:methyltransferase domain-containing protein [Kofleriaceae bacterium]MBP9206656.1 methyltransferase domain-containing protein [Kofleriaceae bacterium]
MTTRTARTARTATAASAGAGAGADGAAGAKTARSTAPRPEMAGRAAGRAGAGAAGTARAGRDDGDDGDDTVDAGSWQHYADAFRYDLEYRRRRDDVRAYLALATRLARPGATVIDLGCGTGRVTLPLARAGFRVVAVDRAPAMLAGLRARLDRASRMVRARVEVVSADLRDFELGVRAPLVIAAFNVVEHLYTRVEVDACLRRVGAHLDDDGRFAFDVQVPDLAWLLRDPTRRWARTRFTDPRTGHRVEYSTNHRYDPIGQIATIRLFDRDLVTGAERCVLLSQRKFFPAELEALVAHAGLRVEERFGDFAGAELTAAAQSQLLVCRPASGPVADRAKKNRPPRR